MNTLIVITGPTAIGKTALSIEIAKALNTEIISADSRQFYNEMFIGTARPSIEEMQGIKHHCIGFLPVSADFNVGHFEVIALKAIEEIFKKKNAAILAGGSGLYINAVCEGFDNLPETEPETREKLKELYKTEGIESIQNKLKERDPVYYNQVDTHNPQRMIRALEVCLSTGKTFSELRQGNKAKRDFNIIKIGLNMPREELYQKINLRVDEMIKNGLLQEVEKLVSYKHLNALQTVGYRELFDYFAGKTDLKSAIELIKQNTRRYAKRQLTWFSKDQEIIWFEPSQKEQILEFIEKQINA